MSDDPKQIAAYKKRFGKLYADSQVRMRQAALNNTPILDLYDIGKDKPNRPSEMLFVERCLQLLKPGGRMSIVLPEGILNTPDNDWLRRWAEGRARLLAVVSLPQETFRSAKATVKASLVFLQRFTEEDARRWETAWTQAHAELDPSFEAQRIALRDEYAPRLETYDNPTLQSHLHQLAELGVRRISRKWSELPEGTDTKTRKRVAELKSQYNASITPADRERRQALQRELDQKLRAIDEAHEEALWARVREIFDYPIFFADPEQVGITSTGADGPNELPQVVEQYRRFAQWVWAGAAPEAMPDF